MDVTERLPARTIAFGDASSIDAGGRTIDPFGCGFSLTADEGALDPHVLLSATTSSSRPLYRREALDEVGGFDTAFRLGEGQELAVRLSLAGHIVHRVRLVVAEIREHDAPRLSRRRDARFFGQQFAVLSHNARMLADAGPYVTDAEHQTLGALTWIVARDAARCRRRREAHGWPVRIAWHEEPA